MKRCLETMFIFGSICVGHCDILEPSVTKSLEYPILYIGYERSQCTPTKFSLYLGPRLSISCIGLRNFQHVNTP
jgi:hypothetical protein